MSAGLSPRSLAAEFGAVLSGMFTTRPMLLAGLLFTVYRQEVSWWWTIVQAFSLLFVAWIVFDRVIGPARILLRARLAGGGTAAKTLYPPD
jgi:p-aminobenzoyl-glutamate transporter AbgT